MEKSSTSLFPGEQFQDELEDALRFTLDHRRNLSPWLISLSGSTAVSDPVATTLAASKSSQSCHSSDIANVVKDEDVSRRLQVISQMKEVIDLDQRVIEYSNKLNLKISLVEAGFLKNGALLDKRTVALKDVLDRFSLFVENKQRIIRQLYVPSTPSDSSSAMRIHVSHHRAVCEVFAMMATFLNGLEKFVENLSALQEVDCDADLRSIELFQSDMLWQIKSKFYTVTSFRGAVNHWHDCKTESPTAPCPSAPSNGVTAGDEHDWKVRTE